MISEDKMDFAVIKSAVKALNELGVLETKIKTIGIGKGALAQDFVEAIEGLSEVDQEQLTDEIVEMYNTLTADETEGSEGSEDDVEDGSEDDVEDEPAKPVKEKAAKPVKEKAAKPVKEKAAKPVKEKSDKPKKEAAKGVFGSLVNSIADSIDTLIAKGSTIEDIMANAGVTRTRVTGHIKFLEAVRGVTITKSESGVITGKK